MGNLLNGLTNAYYSVVNVFKKGKAAKTEFYAPIYEDTFSNGMLNDAIWSKVGPSAAAWCKHASKDDDLFEFTENGLRLHAIKTKDAYRTAAITTAGKLDIVKGKIEVVARMQNCPHSWHAIWMYGENNAELNAESEVDLSECLHDGYTFQTIHTAHLHQKTGTGSTWRAMLKPENWNTFTCEIDDYSVRLYVNGQKTKEFFNDGDGHYGFADDANPMKVILSAQLGGGWPGWPDDDDEMAGWIEIKSFKAWRALN